jgi:putative oxidoreductase
MISRQDGIALMGGLLSVLLSVAFVSSGLPKLMNEEVAAVEFAVWGFPHWSLYVVGGIELLGALAILYRGTLRWGVLLLAAVICGGVVTHVSFGEWQALQQSLAFAVTLAAVAWWPRHST